MKNLLQKYFKNYFKLRELLSNGFTGRPACFDFDELEFCVCYNVYVYIYMY